MFQKECQCGCTGAGGGGVDGELPLESWWQGDQAQAHEEP